jgi:uncharacterized protein (DUF2141 family)
MTNKLILIILLLFNAGLTKAAVLQLSINNLRSNKGKLALAIYNSKQGFLKDQKAFKTLKLPANASNLSTQLELPAGQYSLVIYHDENNNGKLDTNFLGIPTEGFAFSNNASAMFGPPEFDQAMIKISKDVQNKQQITMKHLL